MFFEKFTYFRTPDLTMENSLSYAIFASSSQLLHNSE